MWVVHGIFFCTFYHCYLLFVVIAGDLTDAKHKDDRRSGQFVEEWKVYHQSLEHCKSMVSATFLDTRGNHGNSGLEAFRLY
jgi:hypothetical protein